MPEAFRLPHAKVAGESVNVLEAAARGGMTVVTSAPLLQGRLSAGLPEELRGKWRQAKSDAVFALEFARSTPGVTITLAGMSQPGHVRENLELADSIPMPLETYLKLLERTG
jgi:predicted aldo/keto reductase-like oxidoreductase